MNVPSPAPASTPDRRVAHAIALLPLPSSIWRILLAAGVPLGYTDAGYDHLVGGQPWVLLALTAAVEVAALAALVLVSPRAAVLPRRLVIVLAGIGTMVLAGLWSPFVGWWTISHPGMTDAGIMWVGVLYLPLVAWAPLLGWLTVRYARREHTPGPAWRRAGMTRAHPARH